jgi:hypothetical protein
MLKTWIRLEFFSFFSFHLHHHHPHLLSFFFGLGAAFSFGWLRFLCAALALVAFFPWLVTCIIIIIILIIIIVIPLCFFDLGAAFCCLGWLRGLLTLARRAFLCIICRLSLNNGISILCSRSLISNLRVLGLLLERP